MPKQKDLKHLVRSRMKKTGEAYTAARGQPPEESRNNARPRRNRRDERGLRQEGHRTHLVAMDRTARRRGSFEKPHRQIAEYVSSQGTPDWWSQMVTVGYERIRGLREKGQRRDGGY